MSTQPDSSRSPEVGMCPKCRITPTIAHNGGQWCPLCASFATPPDPGQTAHIPDSHSSPERAAVAHAGSPRCASCGQLVDIGAGVYDDGEWLCGHCIAR